MFNHIKKKLQGFYKNEMPEQRYYSIDELLTRWKSDCVTFQQICDWVEHEEFVLGVRVRDTANLAEEITLADGRVLNRISRRIILGGPKTYPAIRTEFLGMDTLLKILSAAPSVKVGAPVTYTDASRKPAAGHARSSGWSYYGREDLVAGIDEVLRLEAQFKIGAKTPPAKQFWRKVKALGPALVDLASKIVEPFAGLFGGAKGGGD